MEWTSHGRRCRILRNMGSKLKSVFHRTKRIFTVYRNRICITLCWFYIVLIGILILMKYRFSLLPPPAPGAPFADIVSCSASFYFILRDKKSKTATVKIVTIGLLTAVYVVMIASMFYYYHK